MVAAYGLDQLLRQLIPPQPFLIVQREWLIDTVARAAIEARSARAQGRAADFTSLAQSGYLDIATRDTPPAEHPPASHLTGALATGIAARLGIRPKDVEIQSAPFDQNHVERTVRTAVVVIPRTPALLTAETLATRETSVLSDLSITVRADAHSWVTITPHATSGPMRHYARVGLSLIGNLLIIAFFSLWMARSIVRPLTRLASVAERLGRDHEPQLVTDMRLPEHVAIADTFNAMQLRIKHYIDERMQLLAAISHDLRTPLTRLRLLAEYLPEGERAQLLSNLAEMDTMVSDALGFMSGEAHREAIVTIDLAALLISLCDDHHDIGEDVRYSGPDHLSFACRPLAMKRALANLVSNGCKYGERVQVSLRREGGSLVIDIDDDGPGIPADMRERAFQPFQRIETSRNRDTGGTGLGLAIARDIVRSHDGEITFNDRPRGFTVRVTFAAPSPL